jgi:The GLUG motif
MADFGRGIKAGVVTGVVYIVISGILGGIYLANHLSPPFPMYAAGLTPFLLTDLANLSLVMELLFQHVVRGIVFGAVFAAMYRYLPGAISTVKGVVLSLFLCIVALIEVIYMTPGWPIDGVSYAGSYYSGRILMSSSFSMVWPGIISALVFGALAGFLWDGFGGKKLAEERKGRAALLLSFIVGAVTWAYLAALYLSAVITQGVPGIDPNFWWFELLMLSAVFLGLPGWILADVAWRKARVNKSGFRWGVAGGVMMALSGIMLFPGALAIAGGVLSRRKPVGELSTTANVGKLSCYMPRVGIFLAGVIFLILIALIAGTVSSSPPSQNLEIRTWYDLDAVRDNLRGHHVLMNNLDATTPGYEELASRTANQGKGWQPIGAFAGQQAGHGILGFEGTFDGQGYEIRDLFVNRPDENGVGLLWGVGQEGIIEDIGVVNATVMGNAFVGTLVGWNRGAVRNSCFVGRVTGNYLVGGLVGLNDGSVSNSYSTGSVTGNGSVGGLIAQNSGTVGNSYSSASVTGISTIGGLVGSGGGSVSECCATGGVSGNSNVGGLMGSNGGTVTNSYSTGNVTGDSSVGGLVGDIFDGTVSNSYSTGSVTGNSSVGGLVGKNMRSTVSNSFWDTETSGQTISDGGTGKTTEEMRRRTTFSGVGWTIVAVANPETRNPSYTWNVVGGVTYPFLSWHLGCPQGLISPSQIETSTGSGYFKFTVSPAEICANVGEQIEIRCTTDILIDTPIDISSVDVVLFDSDDSIIREQAMTKDYSWWSASTVYTIVGDEAYYQIKVTFSFPLGDPGEHSEYGSHSFPISVKR